MHRSCARLVFVVSLAGGASSAGCSTASVIDSDPRGATVIVDGVRGTTPFTARLPITTFGRYPIRVEMDGYHPYEGDLDREWNASATLLSLAFPPALLWSVNHAAGMTTIRLNPIKRFPDDFARTEPWKPDLPPPPPGMTDIPRSPDRPRSEPPPGERR